MFGIIYTGYAVYQDTNHYLDYPSMILRKEESLGEFNNYCDFDHLNVGDNIFRTDKFSSPLSLFKFITLKDENSSEIPSNNRKMKPKFHI